MIEDFIDGQKSKYMYTRPSQISTYFHDILPAIRKRKQKYWSQIAAGELDTYLADFFMTVHKQNGDEPSDLSSMYSIQCYLDKLKSQRLQS